MGARGAVTLAAMRRLTAAACAYGLLVATGIGCGLDIAGTDFGDYAPYGDGSTDVVNDTTVDTGTDALGDSASDVGTDAGSDVVGDGPLPDLGPIDAGCTQAILPLCDDDAASCGGASLCAPAFPAGWHVVSFGASAPVTCPTGFAAPAGRAQVALYDASAPASCACGCTTTPGSCAGTVTSSVGAAGACLVDAGDIPASPGCADISLTTVASFSAQVNQVASGSSCTPTSAALPPVDAGIAHLCELADASTLCQGHRFCVPLATGSDRACISHDGVAACPSGFPFVVASDIADTRACGCGCATTEGTCNGRVQLYQDAGCQGPADLTIDYDGGCTTITPPSIADYGSINLDQAAVVGASCTASGGLDGSVDASVATVCCSTP